jgi:hypothetical protein
MQFDTILWYRFFDKNFAYGDFAVAGLGIKNSGIDFTLSEKEKFYDMNCYSIFGILDASLLTINGGYIFYSRELYAIVPKIGLKNNGIRKLPEKSDCLLLNLYANGIVLNNILRSKNYEQQQINENHTIDYGDCIYHNQLQ